jgi:hypothetical protein
MYAVQTLSPGLCDIVFGYECVLPAMIDSPRQVIFQEGYNSEC